MSSPSFWYCGFCRYGPMTLAIVDHCVICFRQRDFYATYETTKSSSIGKQPAIMLLPAASLDTPQVDSLPARASKLDRPSATMDYQCGIIYGNKSYHHRHHSVHPSSPRQDIDQQTISDQPVIPTKWFCCQCVQLPPPPPIVYMIREADSLR